MEYRKDIAAHVKIDGLLHGMVPIQEYEIVMRSAVQIVCGKVKMPKVESMILNLQLTLIKDLVNSTLGVNPTKRESQRAQLQRYFLSCIS